MYNIEAQSLCTIALWMSKQFDMLLMMTRMCVWVYGMCLMVPSYLAAAAAAAAACIVVLLLTHVYIWLHGMRLMVASHLAAAATAAATAATAAAANSRVCKAPWHAPDHRRSLQQQRSDL
jgi:hypothetical protein